MNIIELEEKLNDACNDFSERTQMFYKNSECDSDTIALVDEVARNTFNLFDEFKVSICEYLSQK